MFRKIICKIFGHKWAGPEIWDPINEKWVFLNESFSDAPIYCKRCGIIKNN